MGKRLFQNMPRVVNGSKNDSAVVRDDVSMTLDRNIPNSKS